MVSASAYSGSPGRYGKGPSDPLANRALTAFYFGFAAMIDRRTHRPPTPPTGQSMAWPVAQRGVADWLRPTCRRPAQPREKAEVVGGGGRDQGKKGFLRGGRDGRYPFPFPRPPTRARHPCLPRVSAPCVRRESRRGATPPSGPCPVPLPPTWAQGQPQPMRQEGGPLSRMHEACGGLFTFTRWSAYRV